MRIYSGTGEELGRVVGVEAGRDGHPKHLLFVEEDGLAAYPRRVPLRVVRGVDAGGVRLAGPREGYHITRLHAPTEPSRMSMLGPSMGVADAMGPGSFEQGLAATGELPHGV